MRDKKFNWEQQVERLLAAYEEPMPPDEDLARQGEEIASKLADETFESNTGVLLNSFVDLNPDPVRLVQVGDELADRMAPQPARKPIPISAFRYAAVAAVALVAIVGALLMLGTDETTPPPADRTADVVPPAEITPETPSEVQVPPSESPKVAKAAAPKVDRTVLARLDGGLEVRQLRSDQWLAPGPGTRKINLKNRISVRATDKPGRIVMSDGTSIAVNAGTTLLNVSSDGFDLEQGEVFCRVKPRSETFAVRTGLTRVVVTGTGFGVARKGDTTEVMVEKGSVRVENDRGEVDLTAGRMTVVLEAEPPAEPRAEDFAERLKWRNRLDATFSGKVDW